MITHNIEKIDPARAEKILENHPSNRKLSSIRVTHLAQQMKEGAWNFDGAPIRINDKGDLVDGQHRLWAIVESGTTQEFLVLRGVDEASMATMDIGKSRSFSDILTLHDKNVTQTVLLASTIGLLYRWEDGKRGSALSSSYATTPYPKLLAFYDANVDRIRRATLRGARIASKRALAGSTCALAFWLFEDIDLADAEWFFERVQDGAGLNEGHPILTLRNWIIKQKGAVGAPTPVDVQAAYLFKVWNAYRRGDDLKMLHWRRGGATPEAFPEPI